MKKNKLLIILVLILLIVTIIVGDKRNLNFIEKGMKDSFSFVIKSLNIPIEFLKEHVEKIKVKGDLYEENKVLKQQLDEIQLLEAENVQLKNDVQNLKRMLNIDNILSEYDKVTANVINRNFGYWYDNITIDKGSNNGIKEGNPVIISNGLIGYVSDVSYTTSVVKLITSELKNKISVKIIKDENEIFGLLSSYKDGSFIIEGITDDVEINSLVMTAGLGNNYPEGIYIGKVTEIGTDNFGLVKNIKVKSDINYDIISMVSVIIK